MGMGQAEGRATAAEVRNNDGFIRAGEAALGGKAGVGASGVALKGKLGVKAVEAGNNHINGHVGLKVDSGAEISKEKVDVKFLGTGFSAGRDGFGLSTPVGGVNVKPW